MKNLREERTDAEIKQQRKPWDEKYNEKRKMTKQPAATLRCQKYKHNFARNKKRNQLYHQF